MGGGPDKECMVIILWGEEPKEITDEIRRRFPYIEVTYFCLKNASKPLQDQTDRVPRELFKEATILVTLASLPPTPEDAPKLKLIHFFSAGIDHYLDHPMVKDTTIALTTSSGIHGPPIAEWCLMTTLVFSKHYNITYELQKQHIWGKNDHHMSQGGDWVGKRVGILGYGSIGRQVANLFHALGCSILAYTASPRDTSASRKDQGYMVPGTGDPDGTIPTAWFSGTSKPALHTFLSQSLDILVITLPLTPSTHNLLSTPEFNLLSRTTSTAPIPTSSSTPSSPPPNRGRGTFLLNISRGQIVDQPALIDALNTEKLRGAALDVADPEPLPSDNPLWDAKNLIITPHVSALGVEYTTRAYDVLMTNLARREKGEKMFNLVERGRGY